MKNLFDLKPCSYERCLNGMKKKTTILGWSSSAGEFLMKFYEKKNNDRITTTCDFFLDSRN